MNDVSIRHNIDQQYHDAIASQYDHIVVNPRIYTIGLLFEGFAQTFGRRGRMLDLGSQVRQLSAQP